MPADVGANGDWVASGVVSYASNPLVLGAFDQGAHVNDDRAITQRTMFDVGGAYAFLDRFEAGVHMPLYSQSGEARPSSMTMFGVDPASGTARGDLTLHGKARLWRSRALSFGAGLEVTLPTATAGEFTGSDKPSVRVLGLVGYRPIPRLTFSVNAGAVIRRREAFANLEEGSGMAWGAGVSARILDDLWVAGEVFGDVIPSGSKTEMGGKTMLSPIEALGGINYRLERRVTIGLAAGRGVTTGAGSPALRGVFTLTFVSGQPALAPIHPPGPVKIDGDADGDGIPDSRDKCPNEPEDFDMFQDEDGCPDPDNDGDGIPDVKDKCPLDPEDFDGFQDADGCPDKDNDGDGIPDAVDKCPNEPEDKDGFEDLDGCPDPDNDHDGILDADDKCPNEPETINGFQDEDGCPDKGDGLVLLSPDRLELLEAVQFAPGAKIAKASTNLLGQVGSTLRAHTEIVRLRVTVHVQPTKNADRDQELSDKRAAAVRDWLVHWGISATRLEVRGFGGTKPLVPADQKGAAQINDRLELIILERK
jgi:outer membrane protein OmpA-like peptidoglycan-associated protein